MTRILVIDTALGACQAGAFDGARPLALRSLPMTMGGQERIAGLARDVMVEAGLDFAALDRIGVTTGPGSFTGLRVGLAFAQGLGAALDRPVVGVSSLDALAASASPGGAVMAAIDARRGQVYARLYIDGHATGPAEALSLDQATERATTSGPGLRLIGSGAPLIATEATDIERLILSAPDLAAVARLALAARPEDAPPRPLYLRAPDATPSTRRPGAPRTAPA